MSGQQRAVLDEQDRRELVIRRMCGELQERALAGSVDWGRAKPIVQGLIEGASLDGTAIVSSPGTKKRDLAEVRRAWFEIWYRGLGFAITVPKPNATNREFARRAKRHQKLMYEPATADGPYEAFMRAVGRGNHWTVTNEAERAKIGWEPTATGFWHWVDAQDACPRLGTSWNDLTAKLRLLSLEEHVKFWHAVKAETGRMLDRSTWTWLRTRFGRGALRAIEYDGQVRVGRYSAEYLSVPCGSEGGRAADVVK
ncbi:hypothetical protein HY480_00270 [Candidatus Uhrbacteria bacterium]|nr:hypothetical protein [Candidatus Uhrbacteria bacterium]